MDTESDIAKWPIGVWVIACFYFLSFCIAIPSMIYATNNHPEFLERFSTFEIVITFMSMFATLIAVVFLFRLKAVSFWIFLGVAVFSFIPLGIRLISGQEIPIPENMGYGGKVFEAVVWGVVMIYIWIIKSKGILKWVQVCPLTSACRATSKRLRLLEAPDAGRYVAR